VSIRGSRHLLTVLPFMLLYAADEVAVSTRVEDDATGVRSLRIVSRPHAKADITQERIDALLPGTPMRRLDSREVADSYRVTGNVRFVDATALADLHIARRAAFGAWPPFRATYAYADKITRTEFSQTEREVAAAPKTEFTYVVTMPGAIDDNSILPPGGVVEGSTVTWKLKADKEAQDLHVTSSRPDWAATGFAGFLVLLVLLTVLQFLYYRRRSTPRRI
jgi:hypothetical protein